MKSSPLLYSYDLPPDVFGPGEIQPSRSKKKKSKKSDSFGTKRSLDLSEVPVCLFTRLFELKAISEDKKALMGATKVKENYLRQYLGLLMMNIHRG